MYTTNKKVMIMSSFFIVMLNNAFAQCISGNCDNGIGILLYEDKSKYEGNFKDGQPFGKGKGIYANGMIYDGEWDVTPNGFGEVLDKAGTSYKGFWIDGKHHGKGVLLSPDGNKYDGLWLANKKDGYGEFVKTNGDYYKGEWKADKKNGRGELRINGIITKGEWRNDEFVLNKNQESYNKVDMNSDSRSAQTVISMQKQGGVYIVPCKVNNLPLKFIFDTGASDVSISLTEAVFMLKNGYLSESDILGREYYSIANGDIVEGTKINIKEIEFAGLKLYNVEASISHQLSAPLLLGQSVIGRLGKITIDPSDNTLIIHNNR